MIRSCSSDFCTAHAAMAAGASSRLRRSITPSPSRLSRPDRPRWCRVRRRAPALLDRQFLAGCDAPLGQCELENAVPVLCLGLGFIDIVHQREAARLAAVITLATQY